jgi:hypothetical protein
MSELVAPVRLPRPVVLPFHVVPQFLFAQFQSTDFQDRVDASTQIVDLIELTPISQSDLSSLLTFVEPYAADSNFSTAHNVSQIAMAIVRQAGSSLVRDVMHVIIRQFSDRRRKVYQQGRPILRELLRAADHFTVLSELVRCATSATCSAEAFRSLESLLSDGSLDPELLLQFPFFFDAALMSPHRALRKAALGCAETMRQLFPAAHSLLLNRMSGEAAGRTAATLKSRDVNTADAVLEARSQYPRPKLSNTARPISSITDPLPDLPPVDLEDEETSPRPSRRPTKSRAKTEIRFAQSRPLPNLDCNELQIQSSGFYNIGGDDAEVPLPAKPIRTIRCTRPVVQKPVSVVAPRKVAKLPALIGKLQSAEWSEQNDAIASLIADWERFPDEVQASLSTLADSLLRCAASLRSALAKSALTCLLSWIATPQITFVAVCDRVADILLTLVATQKAKHFIADLSGQCFRGLMAAVPASKAVAVCALEQRRRRHEGPRLQIALAMKELVARAADCAAMLRPLAALVRDKAPEVRNAARAAITDCRTRFPKFRQIVEESLQDEENRAVVLSAL